MTKFNVGDEVRIKSNQGSDFNIGDVGVIKTNDNSGYRSYEVEVNGEREWFDSTELELVEKKITKNQRITALENEVAELKLIVHELRGKKSIEPSTNTVVDKPLTPNQQRFLTIIDAKRFIAERQAVMLFGHVDFIVNTEKRTIVALLKPLGLNQVVKRGIAKCDPNDVFNEHIGKAIALGRALGLDVSEFEQAVQPTLAIGQIVYETEDKTYRTIAESGVYSEESMLTSINSRSAKELSVIINDTNAKYEVES